MGSGLPFDDFRALLRDLPGPDEAAGERAAAQARELSGTSLGRLGFLAEWLARWSGRPPAVARPLVALFAGTHGVAPDERSETAAMVARCGKGTAAINQVCALHDLGLKVFDLALDLPTADLTQEAALDERGCAATMAFGMEAVAGGTDLLVLGDIGTGSAPVAAVLLAALFGGNADEWTRPGPGATPDAADRRRDLVRRGLARHAGNLDDPLEAVRRLGGREIAAIAGAILAARLQKVPVLLDGYAATAAAGALFSAKPDALDHCLFASLGSEPGQALALARMGRTALLDLDIAHGEGLGGALAAGIVKAAAAVHSGTAPVRPITSG